MRADGRWRKTGDSNARTTAPTRFPVGDHHLVISSSKRGRRPTRTAQSPAHPLATEPGTPVRFTFRERLTGFEPATSSLARKCSDLLSYNRTEPLPGADPGGTPIPRASGRRSEGHRSGSWTRTSVRLLQGQAGMPSTTPEVRSAGLEPASTWSSTMSVYLFAARAQESRHPVPTRVIRRTKAEPQPCAAAKLGNQGSNLNSLAPEASVLPNYTIPHRVNEFALVDSRSSCPDQPPLRAVRIRWQLAQIRSHFWISVWSRAQDHDLRSFAIFPILVTPSR